MINVRYLINALCLRSHGIDTMKKMIDTAKHIGYTGVQALPLKNTTGKEHGIYYYEGFWQPMPRGLRDARRNNIRTFLEDAVIATSLFAPYRTGITAMACMDERKIPRISHIFDNPNGLVEINHGMDVASIDAMIETCKYFSSKLVADTRHLLETHPKDSFLSSDLKWNIELIDKIAPLLAPVIHVQPRDHELSQFVDNPLATDSGKLFQAYVRKISHDILADDDCDNPTLDIVVEYNPGFKGLLFQSYSEALATKMLKAVKSIASKSAK